MDRPNTPARRHITALAGMLTGSDEASLRVLATHPATRQHPLTRATSRLAKRELARRRAARPTPNAVEAFQ